MLPAGVVDMAEPRPPKDVLLIASKSSLVVRNDLHPAIQYLLFRQQMRFTPCRGCSTLPTNFQPPNQSTFRLALMRASSIKRGCRSSYAVFLSG